jgi:hypothetical protein
MRMATIIILSLLLAWVSVYAIQQRHKAEQLNTILTATVEACGGAWLNAK